MFELELLTSRILPFAILITFLTSCSVKRYLGDGGLELRDAVDNFLNNSSFDWIIKKEIKGESSLLEEGGYSALEVNRILRIHLERIIERHGRRLLRSEMASRGAANSVSDEEATPFNFYDWKNWKLDAETLIKIFEEVNKFDHEDERFVFGFDDEEDEEGAEPNEGETKSDEIEPDEKEFVPNRFEGGDVDMRLGDLLPEKQIKINLAKLVVYKIMPDLIYKSRLLAMMGIQSDLENLISFPPSEEDKKEFESSLKSLSAFSPEVEWSLSQESPNVVEGFMNGIEERNNLLSKEFFRSLRWNVSLSAFDREVLARVYLCALAHEAEVIRVEWTRPRLRVVFEDAFLEEVDDHLNKAIPGPNCWKNSWRYVCLFTNLTKGRAFLNWMISDFELLSREATNWKNGSGVNTGKKWKEITAGDIERMMRGETNENKFLEKFICFFMDNTGGDLEAGKEKLRSWLLFRNNICKAAMYHVLLNTDPKTGKWKAETDDVEALSNDVIARFEEKKEKKVKSAENQHLSPLLASFNKKKFLKAKRWEHFTLEHLKWRIEVSRKKGEAEEEIQLLELMYKARLEQREALLNSDNDSDTDYSADDDTDDEEFDWGDPIVGRRHSFN